MSEGVIAELGVLVEAAARQAAEFIHGGRPERVEVAATKSSSVDPVTVMDTGAEELLRAFVREHRPTDGFLGEEGGLKEGTSGYTWVVDPIDGTVNYLYGLPNYCVSVAVAGPDHSTVAGCVCAPALDRTWAATAGGGATRDGRPIHVSAPADLAHCLVATGFGYLAERRRRQAAIVAALIGEVRDIRRAGSAAIDLCSVADGSLDMYYERGLNPWDLAAGSLIVTEAGGVVTGLHNRPAGADLALAGSDRAVTWITPILEGLAADIGS